MIYFFRRGPSALSCETRLNPDGADYEMVITEDDHVRTERFETVAAMLSREHELLAAWRAVGWREVGPSGRLPIS
ncbi:MAG: hypothetical protein ACRD1V_13005 [Vicinamibacterales bacterium]